MNRVFRSSAMACRQIVCLRAKLGTYHARGLSTTFLEQFRESVSSLPLSGGESLVGHVIAQRRPRSSSSQFSTVDFGLKSEAAFSAKELPDASVVGSSVSRTLVVAEDDFNEPVFDHENKADMPVRLAERYRALLSVTSEKPQFLHGRISSFKRGGATAKILGFDAFTPRHHVLSIESSVVGSYSPFYLLSVASSKRFNAPTALPGIDVYPVVSSYGGILFSLANLVGFDDSWNKSGGGSARERLSYLRLLSRILQQKNVAVRAAMPKGSLGPRSARDWQKPFYPGTAVSGWRRSEKADGEGLIQDQIGNKLRWLDRPVFPRVWEERQRPVAESGTRRRGSAVVGGVNAFQESKSKVTPAEHKQAAESMQGSRRGRRHSDEHRVDDGKHIRDVLMRGRKPGERQFPKDS
jgi:hypothetical protein